MIDFSNQHPEVAIVGRTDFHHGIGSISYATCEVLSRVFPVCFISSDENIKLSDSITLPNGRVIPVCKDKNRIVASFFCDVTWTGVADHRFLQVPEHSLKYAWLVYDSDALPARWVDIFNNRFDLLIATSPHLIEIARRSGVERPIACVPIPLDLEKLMARAKTARDPDKVRFGSVASFHRRKGVLTLLKAFSMAFGDRDDVELVIHSNLAMGGTYSEARLFAEKHSNIKITHSNLNDNDKIALLESFDVFVNLSSGEGYSIGPREALALGKSLVLSAVGGHNDLRDTPGVEFVEADVTIPARYLEIDNGVYGHQHAVRVEPVSHALEQARLYAQSPRYDQDASERKLSAKNFTFSAFTVPFAALIDPGILSFKDSKPPRHFDIPPDFRHVSIARLGQRARRISSIRNMVCPAYDGGFFSVFNAFMSHLVWQQQEGRCHSVYPDWDMDRFLRKMRGKPIGSFCYGRPGDGNIWLKFFQPLYDSTEEQMNDEAFLWEHASEPQFRHNDQCEPLMTYIHAYRLYKTKDFKNWRRQYHNHFKKYIKLVPSLQDEIDIFCRENFRTRRMVIATHVRHPSHTIEQPDGHIATEDNYFSEINRQLEMKMIDPGSDDWIVFLATDQDRVVDRFREKFGDRVCFYPDVRRTSLREDSRFDSASPEERNREGFQLQHVVAADPEAWSTRMGWEVVRDAITMARCHVLLHVVSNVSTAVSYINPDIDLVFCKTER